MLAALGYPTTRLQTTIGQLFRRGSERLNPANSALSDLDVYGRGFPTDPDAAARRFAFEGDRREWLGCTTERETVRLLEQIHNGELASRASSDAMLTMLQQQASESRLPQRIAFRATIAHKTGDWLPIAGHDVGIIYNACGPIVIAVFVSQNRGDFFEVEATHGRVAEAVLDAWGEIEGECWSLLLRAEGKPADFRVVSNITTQSRKQPTERACVCDASDRRRSCDVDSRLPAPH